MKAAHITKYGPSTNFQIVDVDVPTPADTDVLVKVEAAGVIFADVLQRRGNFGPPRRPFPFTMGSEVAGVVARVGRRVTGFEPGQRVVGKLAFGGYADFALVPESTLYRLPPRASFEQGLVYMINLPSAYSQFAMFGQVQPGETLLIHAAAGGVGSLLTQIAKRRGTNITVIALASTDEKLEFCRRNGADHVINYRKEDYVEAVRRITDNRGVDVVFNSVGGATLQTDPKLVKRLTGRWLISGAADGAGVIDPYAFIYESITVRSVSIHTLEGTEEYPKLFRFLEDWLNTEALVDPGHVFGLSEVAAAHDLLEQRRSHGKVVLIPGR